MPARTDRVEGRSALKPSTRPALRRGRNQSGVAQATPRSFGCGSLLGARSPMSDIQSIPLSKLVLSEANVRRTDKKPDLEALAASIRAHGLLQNLAVTARDDGK